MIMLPTSDVFDESNDRAFKGIRDELSQLLASRTNPECLRVARQLARGLRSMAVTFELDVSSALDDLGWHFGNWHDLELTEETAWGLEELGAI